MTPVASSAARQALHHGVELIEVANLQGQETLLAQPAQLEVGLEAQRFLDALLQRLGVGALGRAGAGSRLGSPVLGFRLELAAQALEVARRQLFIHRAL